MEFRSRPRSKRLESLGGRRTLGGLGGRGAPRGLARGLGERRVEATGWLQLRACLEKSVGAFSTKLLAFFRARRRRGVHAGIALFLRDGRCPSSPSRALPAPGAVPAAHASRHACNSVSGRLFAPTEWDKFHREDLALSRAVKACPLAGELFAVCAMMDHWFHFAEGKLILRAASEAAGTAMYSGSLPGISRKVVALAEEPGHFLQNFPSYVVAIQGRMAYSRAGHGGPNLRMLHDGGRRLTSPDLVAFALLFRDIMKRVVAPWALVVQSCTLEPWAIAARRRAQQEREAAAAAATLSMREFLRVLVLLRQHVPTEDYQTERYPYPYLGA